MRGSRRSFPILVVLALIAMSLGAPLSSAQVFSSDYCPAGDQDHGPPDPPGSGADRQRIDLRPGAVDLHFGETGQVVQDRGGHFIARASGKAEVGLEVQNIGNRDSPPTQVTFTLKREGGTVLETRTVETPPIPAGTAVHVTTSLTTRTGYQVLEVEVNPDQDPEEACQDGRPNSACGSVTQGCEYTYYDNNRKSVGIFTGGLPVLRVESISATTPVRATQGPSPDSESEVTLRVSNTGASPAFDLYGSGPDAPFPARITVPDCPCAPQEVHIPRIPAGATKEVNTTLALHGMAGGFTVHVQLDPYHETADLDRRHVNAQDTFHLPTADLFVTFVADHDKEGDRFLVQEGEPMVFRVQVANQGDAEARTTGGAGVRVVVDRDRAGNTVEDTRVVVPAGESVEFTVEDGPSNLSDDHVYRILVDPDDEVREKSKVGNLAYLPISVARYEAAVAIDGEAETTVPPGVEATFTFTLRNQGTVSDTFHLEGPNDPKEHFRDLTGARVEQVSLPAGEEARVQLVRKIPADAEEGEVFTATMRVRSQATGTVTEQNITFYVGPDTVPPEIRLQWPASGFLGDDRIVLEVTDNVAVGLVETDLLGSYHRVEPDEAGGSLYTLDATGTPARFTLAVRATDEAGNEATKTFTFIRDTTPPRLQRVQFAPEMGVRPGDRVNVVVEAFDDHMDRIEVQVTQPRPDGRLYVENITLTGAGPRYVLRDWLVPERPGHYVFNVTAYDKAGNSANQVERLYVRGLNIEILSVQPEVRPSDPREGETVTFTYLIRNTSTRFETGGFFVTFNVDFARQIGAPQRVNLQPEEVRAVSFTWTAEPGPHAFILVVDQAEEVAEDNPNEEDNLHITQTGVLFPDHPLFAPDMIRLFEADSFGALLVRHWYLPLMLLATIGLFAVAFVLARRNGAS